MKIILKLLSSSILTINLAFGAAAFNEDQSKKLYKACLDSNIDQARIALDKGADPNYDKEAYNDQTHTPLFAAINKSNFELAKLLVEKKADVNAQVPYSGDTPLHHAAQNRNFDFAKLLILNGANISQLNDMLLTPQGFDFVGVSEYSKLAKELVFDINNLPVSKTILKQHVPIDIVDLIGHYVMTETVVENKNSNKVNKQVLDKTYSYGFIKNLKRNPIEFILPMALWASAIIYMFYDSYKH